MSFSNHFTIRTRLVALVCLALAIMALLIGIAWVKNHLNANSVEPLTGVV